MEPDYCRIKIRKRFFKCVSVNEGICYLMVGSNQYISKIINTIIKNVKEDTNIFRSLENEQIYHLYDYLSANDKTDISTMKEYISEQLEIDTYKDDIVFVKKNILNDDDTIQDVLHKLAFYCRPKEEIYQPYIYAWYKDKDGKNHPIGFKYEPSIQIDNFNLHEDRTPYEDTLFVSDEGNRVMVPMENNLLHLLEHYGDIHKNTIYFCSVKDYLKAKDYKGDDIFSVIQDETTIQPVKNYLFHSIVQKYWPYLEPSDVINYDENEEQRKQIHRQKKKRAFSVFDDINMIESRYFKHQSDTSLVSCLESSIQMMKLIKHGSSNNIVNLAKIFRDVRLSEKVPFMKLMLETRDDILFKVNNNHIISQGKLVTDETYITKDICKKWSEDLVLFTSFGYRYLHTENAIIMKIYDKQSHRYTSLIIHLNGDVECVFTETGPQTTEKDILILLKRCNEVLHDLNKQAMYSFEPLPLLDMDIYTNLSSPTKLDFKNCQVVFKKSELEDKQQNRLPNFLQMFGTFLMNYPMYFRVKLVGEVDDSSQKIICRYKRVNNYADLETIETFISMMVHLNKAITQDEIIEELTDQFSLEHEEALAKYISWNETRQLKLHDFKQQGIQTVKKDKMMVKEPGAEMIITNEDNLVVTFTDITSFSEYRRMIMFVKTMVFIYKQHIQEVPAYKSLKIFTEVKPKVKLMFEEEINAIQIEKPSDDEDEEDEEDEVEEDEVEEDEVEEDDGDQSDVSDLFSDSDEEDIDFDQLGGAGEIYETKSYYSNRLKSRDPELFKFKTRKYRPSGAPYGYTSFCQTTDSRMPIVVSEAELQRINNSSEQGSGRGSYSNIVTVDGRSKQIYYICPKYWDISKEVSIRPDYIDNLTEQERNKILVPKKLPAGTKGRTDKYILQRTGKYWNEATEIKYYKTMITDESRLLHPEGYGLPCCFNISKQIKRGDDPEQETISKPSATYISKADPVEKDKYAHIHPMLKQMFYQENETLLKKTSRGFIKKGVTQNKSEYLYDECPFLESYCVISGFKNVNTLINHIQDTLENNLELFQRCPFVIHTKFRKSISTNYDYIEKILRKSGTRDHFQGEMIDMLLIQIRKKEFNFQKNEMSYIISLISTLENYCNYLRSNENRGYEYILPVLSIINTDMNVVIFEMVDDNVVFKETSYNTSETYGFIYKRNNYYEPIIYRYFHRGELTELSNFGSSSVINNHLEVIHNYIRSFIGSKKEFHPMKEYFELIQKTKDEVISLYLNHYSQVSYIFTKQYKLIPVPPCQIPDGPFKFIYDFISITDVKQGDIVTFQKRKETIQGEVQDVIDKRNVSVKENNGKEVSLPFSSLCFLKSDQDCYTKRPSFKKAMRYLEDFQSLLTIEGLVVNDEMNIVNIVLTNKTFIPITDIVYNHGDPKMNHFPIVGNHDLLLLENTLRETKPVEDPVDDFYSYQTYEDYIMKLSHFHLIYLLTNGFHLLPVQHLGDKEYSIGNNIRFRYQKQLDDNIWFIEEEPKLKDTMKGEVKEIIDETKMIVSVSLMDYLSTIVNDPIQINQDKKKDIYEVYKRYIPNIFHEMSDDDFEFIKERRTLLCINDIQGKYPCYKKGDYSRLIIKETDYEGRNLLQKIMFRFIDLLLINGTKNIYQIIQETITIQSLQNMNIDNEDVYSYKQFKTNYLDELFEEKSLYIQTYDKEQMKHRKINLRLINENPYFIQRLYGMNVTITFMNDIKNKEFQLLTFILNETVSPTITEYMIKELLIEEIKETPTSKGFYQNEKKHKFSNLSEIIDIIQSDTYTIDKIDIQYIISGLQKKGYEIGCLLFSQKYNSKKQWKHYYHGGSINEHTPIISLCHSYNEDKGKYDLSIIIPSEEYSQTYRELTEMNSIFERFIQLK